MHLLEVVERGADEILVEPLVGVLALLDQPDALADHPAHQLHERVGLAPRGRRSLRAFALLPGDGDADRRGQLVGRPEEAHHPVAAKLRAQGFDALEVAVHELPGPRRVLVQQEEQAGLVAALGLAELELGDGALLLRRDVAVAPGEEPDVEVGRGHVGEALVEGALVGGDVVLHRHHVVPHLAQHPVDRRACLGEILVGRGQVDLRHASPPGDVCRAPPGERVWIAGGEGR